MSLVWAWRGDKVNKDCEVKVYMDLNLWGQLRREAFQRQIPISQLIRHALHKELKESEETRSRLHRELAGQTVLEFK